ncbi:alpha/beta hydrolase family protein [Zhihengliuella flava]|uniref:Alpha/beta-hydrolase family hydrolase n=1 Tax=Zhihengliuella flava TaxID=1285193 RepID=A0A931D8P8_9MICC|nr:alpha/beta family hydrolase [Zhihengliuella flava]MBG6084072.1 putative alpha/beta-hydrolase family hydrolase [Zhihengliuella flava]
MNLPPGTVTIPVTATTPRGTVNTEVSGAWVAASQPHSVVVLAHGAGAGREHPFLTGFAGALAAEGHAVLSFNFPAMDAGKKFPDRPPLAVGTWDAVLAYAAGVAETTTGRIWAAGKSFGARMASLAAAGEELERPMTPAGLIYLGYPLHAPGKPEKLRDGHLDGLAVPQLFVEGTRDAFARIDLMEAVAERLMAPAGSRVEVEWVEGADHSFNIKGHRRPPEECGASLAPAVDRFLRA